MATGLIALLDDVAAIAKVAAVSVDDIAGQAAKAAAASLDDVAGQTLKAGAKSAGLVIDDTAVTPRYVVGFAADRELPIIARIAKGSLRNKLFFLLPIALLLSVFAPWGITPLLMVGGLYLSFEGAEKVHEALFPHEGHDKDTAAETLPGDVKNLEEQKVAGAIRTDFILSAEIMAIALSSVPDSSLLTQAIVLAVVGIVITIGVYGAVGLIVKADDVGVKLAGSTLGGLSGRMIRSLGRSLVTFMPGFLKLLTIIGTAAMLWVGGGIVLHGLEYFGIVGPGHLIHELSVAAGQVTPVAHGFVEWLVYATCSLVFGLALGLLLVLIVGHAILPIWQRLRGHPG